MSISDAAGRSAKIIEKEFEAQIWQELIAAGQLPCKLSFRTEVEDHLCGYAYPDICLIGEDAVTPIIAIECKPDGALQSLSTAFGQCLLYKQFAPLAIICLPSDEALPAVIRKMSAEHDIPICSGPLNFGHFISEQLKKRNFSTLRILLRTNATYIPPQRRVAIPLRVA